MIGSIPIVAVSVHREVDNVIKGAEVVVHIAGESPGSVRATLSPWERVVRAGNYETGMIVPPPAC